MRKNQIIDDFLIFLIAWAVPGILLLASIDPRLHAGAQNSTSENLTKLSNNSKKFKNKFSRSPSNLRELIEYSKTIDSPASIYDNYGNKIELAQLDEKNWILRSHGPNTFAKESKGIHKNIFWAPRTWSGLFRVVSPNFQKPPYFYQPAYLLSMASHDRKYTARLFYNNETKLRTLVVVKNNIKKEPVYINNFDNPEEFLWLPTSNTLVFTSSPDHGRQESIQILDLETMISKSVKFDSTSFDVSKKNNSKKYFATLAGVKLNGFYFYAYDNFSSPLNAKDLFTTENLYEVNISASGKITLRPSDSKLNPFRLSRFLKPKLGYSDPLQSEWFKLKTSGNMESTIESWQSFAVKSQGSPLFPYTLIYLISFYEEAAFVLKSKGKHKDALSLLALSSEYARALARSNQAPNWLSLIGWGAWNSLKNKKPTGLRLSGGLEY